MEITANNNTTPPPNQDVQKVRDDAQKELEVKNAQERDAQAQREQSRAQEDTQQTQSAQKTGMGNSLDLLS